MKTPGKNLIVKLVVSFIIVAFGLNGPTAAFAITATAPSLGTAASFSVLADLSMSAAAAGTTVSGDLGLSTNTATSRTGNWTVHGTEYFGPASLAATAQADALFARNNLAGQASSGTWGVSPWSPAPGVWTSASSPAFTGTITLNGTYDDVWVFQISTDFTFSGSIILTGNAQPCHVFWAVAQDATIASGSTFVGTLIAGRDVTVVSGATVNGRVLSGRSLTTDGNTISEPTCVAAPVAPSLTLNKIVVNNNGGTTAESAWTLTATGPVTLSGSGAVGSTDVASDGTFLAGTYTLSESAGPSGYTASSWSCVKNSGAPVTGASIILASGDTAVCTITNDDVAPAAAPVSPSGSSGSTSTGNITVVKHVINDNNGTKTVTDFQLFIKGNQASSGLAYSFPAYNDIYAVTETIDPGYTQTFSGDCDVNGRVTLNHSGDNKFCIITNDDIGAPIVPPVPPLIEVVKVPSPLALPAGPGPVTYTYTLRNIGTVPVTDVTMVGDTCSPINLISGDSNTDTKLDVNETWVYQCSKTLAATHTNTVVATGWANGLSATDIASATVVVGVPTVPPLIHVTKVPSPLVLLAKGGTVTYTEKITNPGTVALSNVRLTDDKCSPMKYISGDLNGDSKLDPTETWTYTCQTKLTKTTTNTAVAEGSANDLTVRDYAIATVVVADTVPALPNTGTPPEGKSISWSVAALAGVFVILSILYVVRKKQTA